MDDKKNKHKQQVKEQDEFKNKYFRALADYQNLEKRMHEEKKRLTQQAAEQLIHELLVVLDTFENVQKQYPNDQGIKLGVGGFQAVLAYHGLKKIDVLHKEFNPIEMECTEIVENDKDGQVIEEVRPGYRLGDKIIRVARVKVGKKITNVTN